MSKRGLYISGTILFLSILLFLRALTMDLSLPGANVVNLHLMHQQEQLFNFSLLAGVLSGFFFFRAWKKKGKEVIDDIDIANQAIMEKGEQALNKGAKKLSHGFSLKRLIIIVVIGSIAIFGTSIFVKWKKYDNMMRLREECLQIPQEKRLEGIEDHEEYCVRQSYKINKQY